MRKEDIPSIPNNDDCGLFIGVSDYRQYDQSVGQEQTKSSLPGSLNDAKAFWRMARKIGMRPANIRMLTSPPIDPSELKGANPENFGEATREQIEQGVRWLADRLGANKAISGLFTYSGHGGYLDDKGMVLCPSDTRGAPDSDALENVIPFSRLSAIIGTAGSNLTTVLDCCHSGAGRPGEPVPSLVKKRVPDSVKLEAMGFGGRVLAACGPQSVTQQSQFMGVYHGAFTWAITSVLSQWKTLPDGEGRRYALAYGELLARARKLLQTLSFRMVPEITGPDNLKQLAVMQRGDEPADTSVSPDGWTRNAQLDPGPLKYRVYTLTDVSGRNVAQVLVLNDTVHVSDPDYIYDPRYEYWFNAQADLPDTSITFSWEDYNEGGIPALNTLSFKMKRVRIWDPSSPTKKQPRYVNNEMGLCLRWGLNDSPAILTWHVVAFQQQNAVFGAGCQSGATLTSNVEPDPQWFKTKVPTINI